MAWNARLKGITDDTPQFDKIKLEVEYYNRLGRENFFEQHIMGFQDDFETIKKLVLQKLAIINAFRAKVDQLKLLVGKDIRELPVEEQAVSLGLKASAPILK